jgi:hypothetical protein
VIFGSASLNGKLTAASRISYRVNTTLQIVYGVQIESHGAPDLGGRAMEVVTQHWLHLASRRGVA